MYNYIYGGEALRYHFQDLATEFNLRTRRGHACYLNTHTLIIHTLVKDVFKQPERLV